MVSVWGSWLVVLCQKIWNWTDAQSSSRRKDKNTYDSILWDLRAFFETLCHRKTLNMINALFLILFLQISGSDGYFDHGLALVFFVFIPFLSSHNHWWRSGVWTCRCHIWQTWPSQSVEEIYEELSPWLGMARGLLCFSPWLLFGTIHVTNIYASTLPRITISNGDKTVVFQSMMHCVSSFFTAVKKICKNYHTMIMYFSTKA